MMSPPAAPPLSSVLTVAESVPRFVLWILFLYMPSVLVASIVVVAYQIHAMDPAFFTGVPWRLPAIVMWGVYMTLVVALVMSMYLHVPRAPRAARRAILDVGMLAVGLPLSVVVVLVVAYGIDWMFVVLACVLVDLIAAVIALWVWLVRTYN